MLLESRDEERIKCGNCGSEYHPRTLRVDGKTKTDYSCPVCGHGKFNESVKTEKKILLD